MTAGPQTAQGAQQASIRAVTGSAESYEGDWHRLFDLASLPADTFDGRLLRWINLKLSASYTSLPEAQQALATANGAYNWSSMGTFSATIGSAPVNSVAPAVTGTTATGQTLSTTNGTWTGSPTGYTYQWKRGGVAIGSATSSTYTLVDADSDVNITCDVTASNAYGSATQGSNSVGPVQFVPGAIMYHPEGAFASLGHALQASGSDVPQGIFTAWIRLSVGRATGDVIDRKWQGYYELVCNAGGAAQSDSEGIPGFAFVVDNTTQAGTIRANTNDATGGSGHQSNASWFGGVKTRQARYFFVRYAWDNSLVGTNTKRYCLELYQAGVAGAATIQKGTTSGAMSAAFNVALSNAAGFGINVTGSNTPPAKFEMAEPTLHPGSYLDASSNITLAASGFINATANLPRYLGADGSLAYGFQPLFYVGGDKSTISQRGATTAPFSVVVPNATTWVFTPALTPELYNAAVGPAGPQDARPYEVWTTDDHLTGQSTSTASFANNPLSNFGNPIDAGDFILVIGAISDTNSGVDRSGGWTCTQPSAINTFAAVTMTGDSNPIYNTSTFGSMNMVAFWKIADANDVTASGTGWGNATPGGADTNAPALGFSTGGGVSPRSARWQIHVYKQASTIQAAASKKTGRVTGSTGTWVAPTVTAGANCRLITGFQAYDNTSFSQSGTVFHLLCPSGQDLRFKSYGNTDARTYTLLSDEAVAAGATGTRSLRVSGTITTGGTPCNAFSIALGP